MFKLGEVHLWSLLLFGVVQAIGAVIAARSLTMAPPTAGGVGLPARY